MKELSEQPILVECNNCGEPIDKTREFKFEGALRKIILYVHSNNPDVDELLSLVNRMRKTASEVLSVELPSTATDITNSDHSGAAYKNDPLYPDNEIGQPSRPKKAL